MANRQQIYNTSKWHNALYLFTNYALWHFILFLYAIYYEHQKWKESASSLFPRMNFLLKLYNAIY
jgi:hypothetical protein